MDLNQLLDVFIKFKLKVFYIVSAFLLAGVIYFILTPKSFKAETLLLPESKNSSGLGGLGELASSIPGLGSISMASPGSEAIRPEFYPSIVQSNPFLLEFIDYTFYHPDLKDSVNIMTYGEQYAPSNPWKILKKYTLGLPGLVISKVRQIGDDESDSNKSLGLSTKEEHFFRPTVGDFLYLKSIKEVVSVSVDKKTGVIKVSVSSTDPLVAAYLTEFTKEYLINYVTNYRQNKQKNQVRFLTKRNDELEKKFLKDQVALATFKERNYNITSTFLQNEQENLISKYELSKSLYFSINSQLEQARIKLNEETPIFVEIEPVSVPAVKSSPQTMLILFLMGTLGLFVSGIFLLLKLPKAGDSA